MDGRTDFSNNAAFQLVKYAKIVTQLVKRARLLAANVTLPNRPAQPYDAVGDERIRTIYQRDGREQLCGKKPEYKLLAALYHKAEVFCMNPKNSGMKS